MMKEASSTRTGFETGSVEGDEPAMSIWWIIGAIVVIALLGGSGKSSKSEPNNRPAHWIYHPHVIEPDDYECSHCHARFRKESASCPKCGLQMKGKTETDEDEWIDEEEELDIIFDDD